MILVDRAGWRARLRRWASHRPVVLAGCVLVVAIAVILPTTKPATNLDSLPGQAQTLGAAGGPPPGGNSGPVIDAKPPAAGVDRSADAVEAALYGSGSLRQSQPDGGWRIDGTGALLPDIGVRRRFDHLLTALGEASIEELERLLRAQATRDLSPRALEQLMTLWQSYLRLQQHGYATDASIGDPSRWQAALDERVRVRRELLGLPWADAFYRDEEIAVRAHIASRLDPASSRATPAGSAAPDGVLPDAAHRPRPGDDVVALQQKRVAEFGAEAADRLAQEDADQQQWEQRVAQARQRISEWQRAPELSTVQRREAVERFLSDEFAPAERLRVRALLKLDDAP